ncbi:MAG: uracil-DNA glycosylase [Opitutae bacterium]|nr:uracil-DNA glycosylase [Opitutae bacterium]MBT6462593.1 uracil-DNA glycosylase [Opitutae bacterium]MBT7852638.1 uracil-DNA glycosylase [Opitutae bacterium]
MSKSPTISLSLPFALEALVDELKRMKAYDVTTLNVEESTLASLRELVASSIDPEAAIAPVADASYPTHPPQEEAVDIPSPRPAPISAPPVPIKAPEPETHALGDLTPPTIEVPTSGSKKERWEWLREKVLNCETCVANRNPDRQIVFGVGSLDADIFFCGEAPGEEEEKQGEPFVGPAGQKLNGMIQGMGLSRENTYIGNIMNWRPRTSRGYGNRAPSPVEMDFCIPYLKAQLAIVQPKVVVALGNTAIQGILGHDRALKIGKIHGSWYEFEGIPLMPTFHPASLLHNESRNAKRRIWEDLLKVMERLELPISDKQKGYFL